MQQSRREILDEVLDFVGEQGDANARNTAERVLNRALLNIWMKMPWRQFQVSTPYTFSTVAAQALYAMPARFGRVRGGFIRNMTAGARIYPAEPMEIEERDPAYLSSGVPQVYAFAGVVGVAVQVDAAGEALEVLSDSTADTSTVKVALLGLDSNGDEKRAEYELNGTTAVAVGTWTRIMEFGKSYAAATDPTTELTSSAGTVTLRVASGGATRQSLFSYETSREHWEMRLWPTPNVVQSIAVPYLRGVPRLLYDADMLPQNWGSAVAEEMIALWRENTGDAKSHALVPRPALLDLIALENSNRFGVPSRTQPFRG